MYQILLNRVYEPYVRSISLLGGLIYSLQCFPVSILKDCIVIRNKRGSLSASQLLFAEGVHGVLTFV